MIYGEPKRCKKGHPMTPDNVIRDGVQNRCRACRRSYRRAYDKTWRRSRPKTVSTAAAPKRPASPLLVRHQKAMEIVRSLDVAGRYALLAAVVWPQSETLRNMEREAA